MTRASQAAKTKVIIWTPPSASGGKADGINFIGLGSVIKIYISILSLIWWKMGDPWSEVERRFRISRNFRAT